MTQHDLIGLCLSHPFAYEDHPFGDALAVMRHSGNHRMFALIGERGSAVYINLKCEPIRADFLRSVFESVTPGWHMNKTHWNTVTMAGDVPDAHVREMIQHSFDLTRPKARKAK